MTALPGIQQTHHPPHLRPPSGELWAQAFKNSGLSLSLLTAPACLDGHHCTALLPLFWPQDLAGDYARNPSGSWIFIFLIWANLINLLWSLLIWSSPFEYPLPQVTAATYNVVSIKDIHLELLFGGWPLLYTQYLHFLCLDRSAIQWAIEPEPCHFKFCGSHILKVTKEEWNSF